MPETLCQQALERVLTYLRDDGVELTPQICQRALRLIDEAMTEGDGPDLPARCIDRVPAYFDRQVLAIPPASPPLERGHIGYYPHD